MATAKKLPSGTWRVQAYMGKQNGKKIYVSITGRTKREAELKAAEYIAQNHSSIDIRDLTVGQAIERYISAKEKVLSPSTIRGYRIMQRNNYGTIADAKVSKLNTEEMQLFISSLIGKISAKTISNVYGLLSSSVAMFRPDAVFRVTLPNKKKPRKSSPSDEDVQTLFREADGDLKICIALAAFGSMRRGEVCALKHRDIQGNIAHVHADMVQTHNGDFVYKDYPKTADSVRDVLLPSPVIDLIGDGIDDDYVTLNNPDHVSHRFSNLRNRLDLNVCFHDLRHYYASIGAVLGVPDTYLSDFGGWRKGSPVMKEVYQNRIDTAAVQYSQLMVGHFENLMDHTQTTRI